MAVLKNNRTLSQYQYEWDFNKMYEYFRVQLKKVPKRRIPWVSDPLTTILRQVHSDIMELSTGYVSSQKRAQWKHDLILKALKNLAALQMPLDNFWNIMQSDEHHRKTWCEYINKEIALLHGMLIVNSQYSEEDEKEVKQITYYKTSDINNAKFLCNMRELHRYSHTKVIHAKKDFDGFESSTIVSLVNDAWYQCVSANRKIPTTKQEVISRQKHISNAISDLHKMNRPMLSLFILMDYSEREMREWADLLTEQIRLLYALQKSDKKRFGKLLKDDVG